MKTINLGMLRRRLAAFLVLTIAAVPVTAVEFVDVFDFGSGAGKLSDTSAEIANISSFPDGGYTVGYSADSVDFSGTLVPGFNTGTNYAFENPLFLDDLDPANQRIKVDITVGPGNEADNFTFQFADSLFDQGYAYEFLLDVYEPGSYTLIGPEVSNGTPLSGGGIPSFVGTPIDQFAFFSGNFSDGVSQNANFSVDSVSFVTVPEVSVPKGVLQFGTNPDALSFTNGGLLGVDANRGQLFDDGSLPTPIPIPLDTADGLQFAGNVPARSLVGRGVNLDVTQSVDLEDINVNDELVLEIVVGAGNEVRDIIFEIIGQDGLQGQAEISQKSWTIPGIELLEPGTHTIRGGRFSDGTNGVGVFPFDKDIDLIEKIVLFGFNAQNPTEPEAGDVTDKFMDITIKSVQFLPQVPGDYNNNGLLDAGDYTVWRDNLGALDESALGFKGDGQNGVDIEDYNLWKTAFEAQSALGVAVPEPTAALMAVGLLVGFVQRRR